MERSKNLSDPLSVQNTIEAITLSDRQINMEGYWQKEQEKGTEFWYFANTDNNNFFLFHCQYSVAEETVRYTRYYLQFYNDRVTCAVMAPEFTKEMIETGKMNMDLTASYAVTMDDNDRPSRITLKRLIGKEPFIPLLSLQRVIDTDRRERLEKIWNQWTRIDEHSEADYTFRYSLAAITPTHLYVQFDGGCFRIPYDRNPEFAVPGVNDKIGIVIIGNKRYIAYDERGVYIDATDVSRLKAERGIDVVASR